VRLSIHWQAAAAGFLIGLAGVLTREIACPNLSLVHVLLGHTAVAGASALIAVGGHAAFDAIKRLLP
jgi:hypothetical protein